MEFQLIQKYFDERFSSLSQRSPNVLLGIGDDCAELNVDPEHYLLTSSDALVVGKHFFADANPLDVGYKALAVNLSDLAAMGASPLGFTLSLAVGQPVDAWLESFSQGLLNIAQEFNCPLVGGDTCSTSHPDGCFISISIFGSLPKVQKSLRRSQVQIGDDLWVSGLPGLARLGLLSQSATRDCLSQFLSVSEQTEFLRVWSGLSDLHKAQAQAAILKPRPRVALGRGLLGIANSAIDLSDGLAGDLKHLMNKSQVGFEVDASALDHLWSGLGQPFASDFLRNQSLQGGDDYELCFTAPSAMRRKVEQLSEQLQIRCTRIGVAVEDQRLMLRLGSTLCEVTVKSHDHF